MIDSHIHIGQFNDIYTSPREILDFMESVGVEIFAVSSTSTCEKNYEKVLSEMKELSRLGGNRVLPVLWVLPDILKGDKIDPFLISGIRWKMLKIHPQISSPGSWSPRSLNIKKLIHLARELKLPVLIHTGEYSTCHPSCFKEIIRKNPDINFILAHGRPIDQTISIMREFENAWCDTAFMPAVNIFRLCEAGVSDRILWGTDYPIPKYYYPDRDMKQYYSNLVRSLYAGTDIRDFEKITMGNAKTFFDI